MLTREEFENSVSELLGEFSNSTERDICQQLRIPFTDAKSKMHLIAVAIMRTSTEAYQYFQNSGIEMKTIRLEYDGSLKESMSFKQIQFKEIVQERWESSYWYRTLKKRFLFVIFQRDRNGELRLTNVKFWSMPSRDLDIAREFWDDTKRKIELDNHQSFIAASDDMLCHVRPKARDSRDLMETPSGRREKKMAYWLNSSYIKDIIADI